MAQPRTTTIDTASAALLERAETALMAGRRAEAEKLTVALGWALSHRREFYDDQDAAADVTSLNGRVVIYEYAPAELAIALQIHPLAARKLMADAVDLDDRHPHVWAAIQNHELDAWVGRKIAGLTRDLDDQAARFVDNALADVLGTLPPGRLLSLAEARVIEADTALADKKAEERRRRRMVQVGGENEYGVRGLVARLDSPDATRLFATIDDLARRLAIAVDNTEHTTETLDVLRARALGMLADPAGVLAFLNGNNPGRARSVIYVHTTPDFWHTGSGVARVETDHGSFAATRDMISRLLGHDHINLKPVIDLNDQVASDRYEIPADLAERLRLIKPADCFPYAPSLSRRMDRDHTIPWPHGPTSIDNLGHLTRTHHRIKTHAEGWSVEQLPGHRYLWRTPHGHYLLTDNLGTHRITRSDERPRVDLYWAA